jgi:S1-C subfamily serine protease
MHMTHRKYSSPVAHRRARQIPLTVFAGFLFMAITATLGFAQPQAEAKKAGDAAASTAAPTASSTTSPAEAEAGVLVIAVQPGSPAEKAGVARGDIILEANSKVVNDALELRQAVAGRAAGDTLSLKLRHGDAQKSVSITIGTQEGRPWVGILPLPGRGSGALAFGGGRGMMGDDFGYGMRGYGPGMRGPGPGRFAVEGALIESVAAGSPAEKAGLKQGDLILSVDGTAVDVRNGLGDLVSARKVGETVTLAVTSRGQEKAHDVKVTLEKNPSGDAAFLGVQYASAPPRFGGPNGRDGRRMMAGAFIVEVAADGPAAKAGIQARDVVVKLDGTQITSPQQVVDAVGKHKPGDTLVVTVLHRADGKQADITVTLGQNPKDATKAWLGMSMSEGFGPGRFGPGRDADGPDGNGPAMLGQPRVPPSAAGANTPTL